jgi:two-component system chemotaxis response regulator CheY
MSKRLLITDDAMIIREMIKDTVEAAGWEVVGQATNGQEAVEMYAELQPDVMTLDMVMPQYDRLYALQNIRKDFPNAQILMVSALDQTEVLKQALTSCATDFIVKHFEKNQLVNALEKIVLSSV